MMFSIVKVNKFIKVYTFLVHRYCNLVLSIVSSLLPALVMLAPRENAVL